MSTSLSDNNVDMAIFDSYSKTVMRNMSRKKTAVIKKQKNNETGGDAICDGDIRKRGYVSIRICCLR